MEDGGWRMENGGWRVENGGWKYNEAFRLISRSLTAILIDYETEI
jgi:hypothetical protein